MAWGLAGGQLILLGTYVACFELPLLVKLRWVYRLAVCQWLCFTVVSLSQSNEWPVPLCFFADQVIVFVAAMVGAWLARLISKRVVVGAESPTATFKLRIVDMLILTMAVAVVAAVCCRYQDPVPKTMFAGLGYAIMIWGGLVFGAPLAFLLPFTLVGFLLRNNKYARVWISSWAMVAFVILILAFVYVEEVEMLAFIVGIALALFLSTLASRRLGFRLNRKATRTRQSSERVQQSKFEAS